METKIKQEQPKQAEKDADKRIADKIKKEEAYEKLEKTK